MRWRTVFAFRLLILAAHQSGAHAVGVVVPVVVVVAVRVDVPDVVGVVRVRRAGPPVGGRKTGRTLTKAGPPPPSSIVCQCAPDYCFYAGVLCRPPFSLRLAGHLLAFLFPGISHIFDRMSVV